MSILLISLLVVFRCRHRRMMSDNASGASTTVLINAARHYYMGSFETAGRDRTAVPANMLPRESRAVGRMKRWSGSKSALTRVEPRAPRRGTVS